MCPSLIMVTSRDQTGTGQQSQLLGRAEVLCNPSNPREDLTPFKRISAGRRKPSYLCRLLEIVRSGLRQDSQT